MELIHNCQESGDLPDDFKMIVDAPYAMNKLLAVHLENLSRGYGDDACFYKTEDQSRARFDIKEMMVVGSHKQSVSMDKEMAHYSGKAIILASGGMGNFGRSQNYIHGEFGKNALNSIIFNCFQVPGTEGNQLLKGEFPRYKKTGAKILRIEGFTGHASGVEIIDYLKNFNLTKLKGVVITHGRDTARNSMAKYFKDTGFDGKIILSDLRERILC